MTISKFNTKFKDMAVENTDKYNLSNPSCTKNVLISKIMTISIDCINANDIFARV